MQRKNPPPSDRSTSGFHRLALKLSFNRARIVAYLCTAKPKCGIYCSGAFRPSMRPLDQRRSYLTLDDIRQNRVPSQWHTQCHGWRHAVVTIASPGMSTYPPVRLSAWGSLDSPRRAPGCLAARQESRQGNAPASAAGSVLRVPVLRRPCGLAALQCHRMVACKLGLTQTVQTQRKPHPSRRHLHCRALGRRDHTAS